MLPRIPFLIGGQHNRIPVSAAFSEERRAVDWNRIYPAPFFERKQKPKLPVPGTVEINTLTVV
jgi:hypothetical protein